VSFGKSILDWCGPTRKPTILFASEPHWTRPLYGRLLGIALEFGLERVRQEWDFLKGERSREVERARESVERILHNIQEGFELASNLTLRRFGNSQRARRLLPGSCWSAALHWRCAIQHRRSEDLDLAWPQARLPRPRVGSSAAGRYGSGLLIFGDKTTKLHFRTSIKLAWNCSDQQQDFIVNDSVRVSFFRRRAPRWRES